MVKINRMDVSFQPFLTNNKLVYVYINGLVHNVIAIKDIPRFLKSNIPMEE